MKIPNLDFKKINKLKEEALPLFKDEKTKKFTSLVFTLIALSFFGLIAINPTISTIAELNKELEDSQAVDAKLTQKINNITTLQQKYTALQNDLPLIFAAVPKESEVPLFAAQLQALAQNSNAQLVSLQTFEVDVKAKPPKNYLSFNFALVAEGSYNDLGKFLDNLISMQRVVSIDSMSLTKKTGGNTLQLTLKGKTIFSP